MAKEKLISQSIDNMQPPEKRKEIFDTVEPGLALRVTPGGSKTFFYRYRFHGKNKRFTIGKFPGVSLSDARKKVRELRVEVEKGNDPQGEKKQHKNRSAPKTINDLAEEFKKRHFPTLKESTRKPYRSRIDSEILPTFGSMPIEQVSRGDIIAFLEEIAFEEGKQVHANRVRNVFSSMFSFGVQKGIAEYNPVSTVKPVGEETPRKRLYDEEEIKALWKAFSQQEEPLQSVLKMLLICGQRKGETCQMRWDQIKDDVWTIPGEITKNGRTHYVPLPGMAIQVIENLPEKSSYVFPTRLDKDQPIRWISGSAKRIRDLSKVNDFRLHDLRRTAASYMAKLGIDRTVLGKVLNHKGLAGDSQVTAIYDRYEYMDEKQQALQRWSAHLQKIIEGTEAKITKMGS